MYFFTVRATGPDNNIYQDTVAVTAFSAPQLDALLRAKWTSMTDALQRKDITAALHLMYSVSKDRYRTTFNLLVDRLPAIVATHTGLVFDHVQEERAFYELKTLENDSKFSYRVVFIKDPLTGLWMIREF